MDATGLKYTGSLVAIAICAACSGTATTAPSTGGLSYEYIGKMLYVNGRPVTAARPPRTMPRYMTVVPDGHPMGKKFEYIMSVSDTAIFDYPKSDKEVGQIMNAGGEGCTNVLYGFGKKTFWIVGGENQITEYKVLKTPIKTLSAPYSFLTSCGMNTSGDLAVGVLLGNSYGPGGQVVIFKNATGSPTVYNTPLAREYSNGYDPSGNLFADGFLASYYFGLVELPKGSSKFETITTSNSVQFPGSVQWDGKYLTVFDQGTNDIYQYTVSGTTATLKNTVQLSGAGDCAQTWIVKGLVYCADAGNDEGEVFKYPAGGSAVAVLMMATAFQLPLGVVAAKR